MQNRSDVCYYGFEANPDHYKRLKKTEKVLSHTQNVQICSTRVLRVRAVDHTTAIKFVVAQSPRARLT